MRRCGWFEALHAAVAARSVVGILARTIAVSLALGGLGYSKGSSVREDPTEVVHFHPSTGEHPFFVLSAASPGFVQAKDLRPGDQFFLSGGRHAFIASIEIEEAPPGETFTTYNFEVEEFHTYFAGPLGVWVHNSGPNYCGMMMGEMHRIATSRGLTTVVGQRTELLIDVVLNYRKGKVIIPDQEIAWAARKVCEYEHRDYVTSGSFPKSYQWWKESFFQRLSVTRRPNGGTGDFDIHHDAEKQVLGRLNIRNVPWGVPPNSDHRVDIPGFVLARHPNADPPGQPLGPYHSGEGIGLSPRITSEVMSKTDPAEMLQALKELYNTPPFNELNLWPATRDFLRAELNRANLEGIAGAPSSTIVPD